MFSEFGHRKCQVQDHIRPCCLLTFKTVCLWANKLRAWTPSLWGQTRLNGAKIIQSSFDLVLLLLARPSSRSGPRWCVTFLNPHPRAVFLPRTRSRLPLSSPQEWQPFERDENRWAVDYIYFLPGFRSYVTFAWFFHPKSFTFPWIIFNSCIASCRKRFSSITYTGLSKR